VKKILAITFSLLLVGGVALFASAPKGIGMASLLYFMDEDKKELVQLAQTFLESIQYKDFKSAALFHNEEDKKKVDIPKLIERLFKVKHEVLNIRDMEVSDVTIDSTGKRARTFFNANIEVLNSLQRGGSNKEREHRDTEGILYWQKENGKWVMKLESSLKNPKFNNR
jgi:hypothetical protein